MPILGIVASAQKVSLPTPPIAGYVLWLDAADTATITLSGSEVTQWNDKSGNNYHFSQSTAAYRPASGTRTQNGYNVLDFGTNDNLVNNSALSTFKFIHSAASTIFIACKFDVTNVTSHIFGNNEGGISSAFIGFNYYGSNSGKINIATARGASGTWVIRNSSADSAVDTNFTYLTHIGDPTNGTAANRSDHRVKTGAAIKNNADTGAVNTSNPDFYPRIGDYDNGANLAIDGMIGEILVYNSILSAGDITSTQSYLATKWGV